MENYLKRALFQDFTKKVLSNKVLILLGARRVGKTEILKNYLQTIPNGSYLQLNGEDINDANLLKERSVANYKRLLHNIDLLVIDEAQNIPDIGLILKLIVDSIEGIKIIATGSSIFDLNNNLISTLPIGSFTNKRNALKNLISDFKPDIIHSVLFNANLMVRTIRMFNSSFNKTSMSP